MTPNVTALIQDFAGVWRHETPSADSCVQPSIRVNLLLDGKDMDYACQSADTTCRVRGELARL